MFFREIGVTSGRGLRVAPFVEAGIAIRDVVERDLDGLEALEARAFATDRLARRSLKRFAVARSASLRVAAAKGKVVGYSLVLFRNGSTVARLYSLAVDGAARGAGVGASLLADAERVARRRGARVLRLEVRPGNRRALRLYRARGYREFGRYPAYYGDGSDALRCEKVLAPRRAEERLTAWPIGSSLSIVRAIFRTPTRRTKSSPPRTIWRARTCFARSRPKIINLSRSFNYQSRGYYCSLLVGWRPDAVDHLGARRLRSRAAVQLRGVVGARVASGIVSPGPESAQGIGLMALFPLAFVSNAMVPTQRMPLDPEGVADWNPVSAVATVCRGLLGNPNPSTTIHAWPMRHPVLAALACVGRVLLRSSRPCARSSSRRQDTGAVPSAEPPAGRRRELRSGRAARTPSPRSWCARGGT